jgi:hypothetical protein
MGVLPRSRSSGEDGCGNGGRRIGVSSLRPKKVMFLLARMRFDCSDRKRVRLQKEDLCKTKFPKLLIGKARSGRWEAASTTGSVLEFSRKSFPGKGV